MCQHRPAAVENDGQRLTISGYANLGRSDVLPGAIEGAAGGRTNVCSICRLLRKDTIYSDEGPLHDLIVSPIVDRSLNIQREDESLLLHFIDEPSDDDSLSLTFPMTSSLGNQTSKKVHQSAIESFQSLTSSRDDHFQIQRVRYSTGAVRSDTSHEREIAATFE